MGKINDITGQRFGRWTVLELAGQDKFRRCLWLCECDCGKRTIAEGGNLRSGATQSCGCSRKNGTTLTHGDSRRRQETPEYMIWKAMHQRCRNPNHIGFKNYGGRGITVSKRWSRYENFLADMGRRPTPKHTIERMNNDGNYTKRNCKWATRTEQRRNRRESTTPSRPNPR